MKHLGNINDMRKKNGTPIQRNITDLYRVCFEKFEIITQVQS